MRRHRSVLTNCPYCNIDLSVFSHPQQHIGHCRNCNIGAVPERVFDVEVVRPPDPANPPLPPIAAVHAIDRQINPPINIADIIPNEEEFPVPQEVNVAHNFNPNVAERIQLRLCTLPKNYIMKGLAIPKLQRLGQWSMSN